MGSPRNSTDAASLLRAAADGTQPRSKTSSIVHPTDGFAPRTWYARHDVRRPNRQQASRGKRLGPPKLGDGHRVPQLGTRRRAAPGSNPLCLCASGFLLFQQGVAGDFQGSFQIRKPQPSVGLSGSSVPLHSRLGFSSIPPPLVIAECGTPALSSRRLWDPAEFRLVLNAGRKVAPTWPAITPGNRGPGSLILDHMSA
jgi:hypothetical protein